MESIHQYDIDSKCDICDIPLFMFLLVAMEMCLDALRTTTYAEIVLLKSRVAHENKVARLLWSDLYHSAIYW